MSGDRNPDWRPGRRDMVLAHVLDAVTALMSRECRDVFRKGVKQAMVEHVTPDPRTAPQVSAHFRALTDAATFEAERLATEPTP